MPQICSRFAAVQKQEQGSAGLTVNSTFNKMRLDNKARVMAGLLQWKLRVNQLYIERT